MRLRLDFKPLAVSVVLAVAALTTPHARAGFVLGTAANYAVLVEPGAHGYQLNNATINGNVGIGAGLGSGQVQIASNGLINPGGGQPGRLDVVDATVTVSFAGNVSGGVFVSQSQVTTAINTVNSLNTTLGAESGTSLTISGGGQVINATSGTLDGSGNFVFTVASNHFTNNSSGITINGTASQYVVINIDNGTSNESFGGPINLTGGITSDHVLFNFVGTSGNLSSGSANGAAVNGVFLAPNMLINVDNIVFNGRLFGGRTGTDFQTVSGFTLNQPTVVAAVPEPASLLLLAIGGLGALSFHRLRVRQRAA